jgi:hypothetical protein
MKRMDKFEYQIDMRLDEKSYCRTYQHGIPAPIGSTDDYETEEEAIEATKETIKLKTKEIQ